MKNDTYKAQFMLAIPVVIIAFILSIFNSCNAQPAVVTLKDGTENQVHIQANNSTQLFTRTGNVNYAEIESVKFQDEPNKSLQEVLSKNGIKILIGELTPSIAGSPIVLQPTSTKTTVEMVDFDKFTKQRDAGKILQLLGVAAVATASYLQIKYAKDNQELKLGDKPKEVPQFLPLAGLGAMGIGIIIDIGASKHLRKR